MQASSNLRGWVSERVITRDHRARFLATCRAHVAALPFAWGHPVNQAMKLEAAVWAAAQPSLARYHELSTRCMHRVTRLVARPTHEAWTAVPEAHKVETSLTHQLAVGRAYKWLLPFTARGRTRQTRDVREAKFRSVVATNRARLQALTAEHQATQPCPSCHRVSTVENVGSQQIRGGDEGRTYFFRCACGHEWSEGG